MSRSLLPVGFILLMIGIVFISFKIGVVLLTLFWPLILLAAGWMFHRMVFRSGAPVQLLVPGGLFVISSLPLLYGTLIDWAALKYLWPLFLFGLAIGLYEYYRYARHSDTRLFAIATGAGVVAAISLSVTLFMKLGFFFVAILLIVAGFLMIRRARLR